MLAATEMTTVLPPSARNHKTMTFPLTAPCCPNMWPDSSSPAASSNISMGRISSHSPYEILNSPSNSGSTPSLQLTLSHNGSDTSDSGAWVNPAAEPSSGAPARQRPPTRIAKSQQHIQLPPRSVAPISTHSHNDSILTVGGAPASYSRLPNSNGSPGQHRITTQSLHSRPHSNSTAISSGWEEWDDLTDTQLWYPSIPGAELSWNGRGLVTQDQPVVGASSHIEATSMSTSYPQAATTIDTLRLMGGSTSWWKEFILNPHHQLNNQRHLLGIPSPVGSAQGLFVQEPTGHIQMAASPGANSSVFDFNAVSTIPPQTPRATLATASTSSTSPSRVLGGLSILPAAGPRSLKRRIEDDPYEVPKSTKIARPADVGPEHGSSSRPCLVSSPQQVTKKKSTRHQVPPAINDSKFIECVTHFTSISNRFHRVQR